MLQNENLTFFLSQLTDRELAFFSKFRGKEFMRESQDIIYLELRKRNLRDSNVIDFTKDIGPIDSGNCLRCGSDNFSRIKEIQHRNSKIGGYEVEINSRKCRICGYNAHNDKPINWRVCLNRFLGKYAWTKLK